MRKRGNINIYGLLFRPQEAISYALAQEIAKNNSPKDVLIDVLLKLCELSKYEIIYPAPHTTQNPLYQKHHDVYYPKIETLNLEIQKMIQGLQS